MTSLIIQVDEFDPTIEDQRDSLLDTAAMCALCMLSLFCGHHTQLKLKLLFIDEDKYEKLGLIGRLCENKEKVVSSLRVNSDGHKELSDMLLSRIKMSERKWAKGIKRSRKTKSSFVVCTAKDVDNCELLKRKYWGNGLCFD